ncbi:unnamed protein product [Brassica oleracea var. botrytis]|uniref:(rape) hypothetical protein n=1 Tax=Brassica napus TaxID=3708 RepID=A0A816Q1E1_BRANA|nr:unnamed protein product [Brassica napus]
MMNASSNIQRWHNPYHHSHHLSQIQSPIQISSTNLFISTSESGLIHLDDHGISKFIISSHTPRPYKTATSSPLLSSSSLSPNLRYVRRKLTLSPRALPLLMGVVSSSTYLQAGLEKGDNCVMVCLCWKVTTILSLSFYQVSVILYLFHLLFVSLASLCHLSFLVHLGLDLYYVSRCNDF